MFKRSRLAIVVSAVVAVTAVVVLLSVSAGQRVAGARQSTSTGLAPDLVSHYSTLRMGALASHHPIPARFARDLDSGFGLEPNQARLLSVEGPLRAWFVPGSKGACLVWLSHVGAGPLAQRVMAHFVYGKTRQLDTRGLFALQIGSGKEVILGVVPDGTSVSVTTMAGSTEPVPVTANAFAVTGSTGTFHTLQTRRDSTTRDRITLPQ